MSADLLSRPPRRYFWLYTAGFCALLASLAILEHEGFPRFWLGYLFLFTTIVVYGLYLHGFDGLAYILGWTGGFCLIALLIAPYLRRLGQYTVPDYLAARYAGTEGAGAVRAIAVIATLIISFTYVVAQIYGVGLITSRFTGIDFSVGIFLGLASILVCSFLGGMRAITWTQIAQYVIVIIAFMIPVSWLALKQTGIPLPQIAYGPALERLAKQEQALTEKDSEQQVRKMYLKRAQSMEAKIVSLPRSWDAGRAEARKRLQELQTSNASLIDIKAANRALADYPKSPDAA
ncbi:MAG: cation acetate symporter, partial [Oxalobacteraceae bacterium]|nr:cation acetate symporter [Oxalobacteraceae bacterium]